MNPFQYELSHLETLEAESVHIFREVAAEFERPVLLFSGGKDSIVLLRLAEKAFRPGRFPFPIMHVDTGHNFPEVIEFRDRLVSQLGERLIVANVQDSIDSGRVVEETGPRASRNRLQTTTLLDEPVAKRDHLGEVVSGVDVHDREREAAGAEGFLGEPHEHDRVLAAAEQQHGPLEFGCHLAHHVNRLGLELTQVGELWASGVAHQKVSTCNPHSVLSVPAQRPSRPLPGCVQGAQPIEE